MTTPARQPQYKEHKVPLREHCKRESRCYYKPNKPCKATHCEYDTRATHTSPQAPTHQIIHNPDEKERKECGDCEAESCSTVCIPWINEHDAQVAKAEREQALHPICVIHERFKHLDALLSKRDPDCPMMMCYVDIWEAVKESLRTQQENTSTKGGEHL